MTGTAAIIAELVSTHGEEGVCPTADDWRSILSKAGPLHLLNLLKFRDRVETADGPMSGRQAYRLYAAGMAGAFARAGAERLFFGPVASSFGLGDAPSWDAAILIRYPSSRALADMWLDPDFVRAHKHRADGVERSQVLVFDAAVRSPGSGSPDS